MILAAALAIGLSRTRPGFPRYAWGFAIVVALVLYAGASQHTL
jgi:predicted branched-subunit amino acid permease